MPQIRLFLLGFLTLFLELTFIRYLAGSIWNLGYFPNLVLLAVFLGMGVGFTFHFRLDEKRSNQVFMAVPWLLLTLLGFVATLHPGIPGMQEGFGDAGGELFFTSGPRVDSSAHMGLFVLWFLMVVAIFAAISQKTAKWFASFHPLHAYTLDISGSCCGILCFMGISFWRLPAWSWFLALIFIYGGCLQRPLTRMTVAWVLPLLICVGGVANQDRHLEHNPKYDPYYGVTWSPYQKLSYVMTPDIRLIFVNGLVHQGMNSVEMILNPTNSSVPYSVPYQERARHPELGPYKRVLILGAGSGNDVTAALHNGVEHVDAVDIDPVIVELGKKYHPGHPYDDPRVTPTIDDGRAFLTRATQKYDLIIFALTDSLVKVSPMSQLRLENYLFSTDSVKKAYSLLTPDGSLMFYNFYRNPWLLEKIKAMIIAATGHAPTPLLERGDDFQMLLVSQSSPPASPVPNIDIPVDDWPFLYLKNRGVPVLYQYSGLTILALVCLLMYFVHDQTRSSPVAPKLAFAFMGTAFMLLESKTVIQFSLLFGTTWLNNSLVFLAILLMVLAANWMAMALNLSTRKGMLTVFCMLLVACLIPLLYPMAGLLQVENPVIRFFLASLLAFSPIFFGNLLFSAAFRNQPHAEQMFGWNLIGASLGGILEYSSLALGYNALSWLVAACYVAAFSALLKTRLEQ